MPGRLIELWRMGAFELVVSEQLLTEVEGVLLRPKFARLDKTEIAEFFSVIRQGTVLQPDPASGSRLTDDPGDDYLVRLARSTGARALVSGDAHLTGLSPAVCRVVTPREAVELLERA